ncbi:MAG TPA: hypothetical protein VMR74_06865 [Gammaproteobacteria bacterium]|nr:hypothetical protein [Gammaproteobacteria bacterium]
MLTPFVHVFVETVDRLSFYHYDPYAQLLSKVVRDFARDLADARAFIASGMVDPERFRQRVAAVSESVYSKYPRLSSAAVRAAVDDPVRSIHVRLIAAESEP